MTVSDSDGIIKSYVASFSPVGWLLTVENLALTIAQETDGITYRPGTPQTMHNTYRACAPPIIRPHPLIYIFWAELHKKGPAGSEKQVINLVWPSGGSRGGSQGAKHPSPFWLDHVLTSTDDRLNGTLLPGWRTKITASVPHLSMP